MRSFRSDIMLLVTIVGMIIASFLGPPRASAQAPLLDDTIEINANGVVRALAVQPDGKTLVGGHFTQVAGEDRVGVARLNMDGSLDTTFSGQVHGRVYALAVLSGSGVKVPRTSG